LNRLSDQLCW